MGYTVSIVGEQHYREAVAALVRGQQVWLEPEPDNAHDPRAVRAVDADGRTLGYVPRDSWVHRVLLDEGKGLRAFVTALEREGADNRLGVLLDVEVVGAAAADEPPVPAAPLSGFSAKPGKNGCGMQIIGGAVVVLLLMVLVDQCSGGDAGRSARSLSLNQPVAQLAPDKVAQCKAIVDGLVAKGTIREHPEPGRVVVEETEWAAVPYKEKQMLVAGISCADFGSARPPADSYVRVIGYRSGERLMTLSNVGEL